MTIGAGSDLESQAADLSSSEDSAIQISFDQPDNTWPAAPSPENGLSDLDSQNYFGPGNAFNIADFGPNDFGVAVDAAGTDSIGSVTSFIKLQAPLVPIYQPSNLNPGNGNPVVVTPEPNAFVAGTFCLFIIYLLQRLSAGKMQLQPVVASRATSSRRD